MNMNLRKLIAEKRKEKGLTQEELAERACVTIRTIQRLENGENTPRSHTLKAVVDAL
ncbi:MAG: helix-turn-helix transcriptional regulator [Bacteroidetes bacterium]|nr:helix-turn-helix transcriptional regulator [Fibrella sp.]